MARMPVQREDATGKMRPLPNASAFTMRRDRYRKKHGLKTVWHPRKKRKANEKSTAIDPVSGLAPLSNLNPQDNLNSIFPQSESDPLFEPEWNPWFASPDQPYASGQSFSDNTLMSSCLPSPGHHNEWVDNSSFDFDDFDSVT